ncbi:MAG: hypothetical protein AAGF29_00130 [Pseudomonadota bacterium]
MLVRSMILTLACMTTLSGRAEAQQLAALTPPSLPVLHGAPQKTLQPDTSALRYYAKRGEQERAQRELTRLRMLYPSWTPPQNIFADEGDDERVLWDLLAEDRIDAVKEKIASLRDTLFDYNPSIELQRALVTREHRQMMLVRHRNNDWSGILELADRHPQLLAGDDLEVLWLVAEAYARLERDGAANEAFLVALSASDKVPELQATLEKASQWLAPERTLALLAGVDNRLTNPETRRQVEDAIVRGALVRTSRLGETHPDQILELMAGFEARARSEGRRDDMLLLAWSHYGRRDWPSAADWFDAALAVEGTKSADHAKAIEGLLLSLDRAERYERALPLAKKHRDLSNEIGLLYVHAQSQFVLKRDADHVTADVLNDLARYTTQLKAGEGAEALGWTAHETGQHDTAAQWFALAMRWEETETAVYGLALSAMGQKDRAAFDALQTRYGGTYEKIAKLKWGKRRIRNDADRRIARVSAKQRRSVDMRKRIANAYESGRYTQCLSMMRSLRKGGPLKARDQEMRGWCLMKLDRAAEAERAFGEAVRLAGGKRSGREAAYGHALATLRNGKTRRALLIADANRLTGKQRRVIDIEVLTQQARAAFDARDYAGSIALLNRRGALTSEPRDLTLMRGWAHYHGGNAANAKAVFARLDAQMSSRASRKGLSASKRKLAPKVTR